jgi:hypothetical protein
MSGNLWEEYALYLIPGLFNWPCSTTTNLCELYPGRCHPGRDKIRVGVFMPYPYTVAMVGYMIRKLVHLVVRLVTYVLIGSSLWEIKKSVE